ncbi:MAG: hypothetical protein FWC50_15965, partial [Planctomycetaceae bacterium]|nr:hypothetical protein [Planctomycetaceae bacterium]
MHPLEFPKRDLLAFLETGGNFMGNIVLDIKDWRENHRLSLQSFKKFGRSFLFLLITFVASRTC